MEGFYVDIYGDKARDSAFQAYLERGSEDPTKYAESTKEAADLLVDSEQLYQKFREKLDYQKIFDEWFERENNG